eukprot:TRINITY_DN135895_c0_g1_i1.p1 TRINITY_DN135895_c0_g1~~TRINITY_DN135895_c0_g1_i1.p1  ORF type:complete len:318 (-),score=24.07 TRINITY_DN135895_c0_g1_i1:1371-2255(-)
MQEHTPSKGQPNDSFEVIRQSRNEILGRSASYSPSERIVHGLQPALIPHCVHLTAVDPKRRKVSSHAKPQQSPAKYVHRSILSEHELFPAGFKPEAGVKAKRDIKSQESAIGKMEEEKIPAKRGKSLDYSRSRRPTAGAGLEKVMEEVKKRKQREQEMEKILDQIITGNTTFEDIFSKQQRTGKHQQIISAIPAGVSFPTPRSANVPSPMTGRFNIPDDESKENTIRLGQLPSIKKDILDMPQALPVSAVEIQVNQEENTSRRKVLFGIGTLNRVQYGIVADQANVIYYKFNKF